MKDLIKKIIKENGNFKRNTGVNLEPITEVGAMEIAEMIKSIPCISGSVGNTVSNLLTKHGYSDVNVKFLGYGENKKILQYIVQTSGPILIIDTKSNPKIDPPCLDVLNVSVYLKKNN